MTACGRDNCGHAVAHHEVSGGCLVEGCGCSGFKVLTAAERKGREITRCSGCGQRVQASGPHGSALNDFGRRRVGVPCPRKGLGADREERWKPS